MPSFFKNTVPAVTPAGPLLRPSGLSRGLVGLWLAHEGAGTVMRDLTQRPGADAALTSGAVWASSPLGPAIKLASSRYARVGSAFAPHLDFTGPFTVAGYVRLDSSGSDGALFAKIGSGSFSGYMLWKDPGYGGFKAYINGAVRVTGSVLTAGTWHHVVMTWDGATVRLYLDGRPDGSAAYAVAPSSSGQQALIGAYTNVSGGGPVWFLQGAVGYVGLWGRALSAPEISDLALRPLALVMPVGSLPLVDPLPISVTAGIAEATLEALPVTPVVSGTAVVAGLPSVAVQALGANVVLGVRLVDFLNRTPSSGATFYRGPSRISWDALATTTDPVRSANLRAWLSAPGRATREYPVTYLSTPGGWHCTIEPWIDDGTTYTVTVQADTVATAGDPTIASWSFSTALSARGVVALGGAVPPPGRSLLGLVGAVAPPLRGVVSLAGAVRFSGLREASALNLAGGIGLAVDIRTASFVGLQGWITEYFSEPGLRAAVQSGEPVLEDGLRAAIEVQGDAAERALRAAIEVFTNAAEAGLRAAVEVAAPIAEPGLRAAVQSGAPEFEDGLRASVDVKGAETEALMQITSPSLEWAAEDDSE